MRTIVGLLKIYWKPLTLIALVALSLWGAYSVGYDSADKSWQLRWAKRDKADSDALAQRQAEARIEERRRQQAINKVIQNASQQIYAAHNDAVSANAIASRLHEQTDKLAQRLADRERACNPTASGAGQTASGTQLLADLFKRADEEAGGMAAIADEARVRGLACEQAYSGLVPDR
ncbi:DUF2514 domain-containing protein [Hafnia paralvei]|uniref:DUF2514 domain-containing protein n=1 Tax=Hafnia paralvei TaxID=546367 RepID=UPI001033A736|nr:DUF2514 domain-containing protein [Hafnia paralvei]TBM09036.1 DUF2514 domain-containing protein [Hafnia paralvei]